MKAILNLKITLKKTAKLMQLSPEETSDQAKYCLRDPAFFALYLQSFKAKTKTFQRSCEESMQLFTRPDAGLSSSWVGIVKSMQDFSKARIDEVCLLLNVSNEQTIALASKLLAVLSPLSEAECYAKVLGQIKERNIMVFIKSLSKHAANPMQTLEELHLTLSIKPSLGEAFYQLTLYLISLAEGNVEKGLKLLFKFTSSQASKSVEPSKLKGLARALAEHCSGVQRLRIIEEFSKLGIYLGKISKATLMKLIDEQDNESAFILFRIMEDMSSLNLKLKDWVDSIYKNYPLLIRVFFRKLQAEAKNKAEVIETLKDSLQTERQFSIRSNKFSMDEALLPHAKVHYSYKKDTNVLYWTNIETAETLNAETSMTFFEGCSYVDIPDLSVLLFTGGGHSKTAAFLELENFRCSITASMIGKKSWHGSVYFEGKVYVIGGQKDPKHYTETCECFDLERKVWTQLSSMPDKLSDFTPIVTEGKVYILGGRTGKYSNKILSYDISSDVWEVLACKIPIKDCSFPCFKLTVNSTLIYFVQKSCLWTFCSRQTQLNCVKRIEQEVDKDGGPCYVYANRLYSPCDKGASSVVRL
jgi:hypothetical protein